MPINIAAQYYETHNDVGYVVLDADASAADSQRVLADIRALEGQSAPGCFMSTGLSALQATDSPRDDHLSRLGLAIVVQNSIFGSAVEPEVKMYGGARFIAGWRMTRQQTREARERLRISGDLEAAERLLRHSIACGHQNLVVRRFLLILALGLRNPERYESFFQAALRRLRPGELYSASRDARVFLDRLEKKGTEKPEIT